MGIVSMLKITDDNISEKLNKLGVIESHLHCEVDALGRKMSNIGILFNSFKAAVTYPLIFGGGAVLEFAMTINKLALAIFESGDRLLRLEEACCHAWEALKLGVVTPLFVVLSPLVMGYIAVDSFYNRARL